MRPQTRAKVYWTSCGNCGPQQVEDGAELGQQGQTDTPVGVLQAGLSSSLKQVPSHLTYFSWFYFEI